MTTFQDQPPEATPQEAPASESPATAFPSRRAVRQSERQSSGDVAPAESEPLTYMTRSRPQIPRYDGPSFRRGEITPEDTIPRGSDALRGLPSQPAPQPHVPPAVPVAAPAAANPAAQPPVEAAVESGELGLYRLRDFSPEGRRVRVPATNDQPEAPLSAESQDLEYFTQSRFAPPPVPGEQTFVPPQAPAQSAPQAAVDEPAVTFVTDFGAGASPSPSEPVTVVVPPAAAPPATPAPAAVVANVEPPASAPLPVSAPPTAPPPPEYTMTRRELRAIQAAEAAEAAALAGAELPEAITSILNSGPIILPPSAPYVEPASEAAPEPAAEPVAEAWVAEVASPFQAPAPAEPVELVEPPAPALVEPTTLPVSDFDAAMAEFDALTSANPPATGSDEPTTFDEAIIAEVEPETGPTSVDPVQDAPPAVVEAEAVADVPLVAPWLLTPPPVAPVPVSDPAPVVEFDQEPALIEPENDASLHWSAQAEAEDPPAPDAAVSWGVGESTSAFTTSALVLPTVPQASDMGHALTSTGEILITGSLDLPRGLGSTGGNPEQFDTSDIDHLLDPGDREQVSTDSSPVRAVRAISTGTGTHGMVATKKPGGNRTLTVLVVSASAMAVGVVALFVAGMVFNIF